MAFERGTEFTGGVGVGQGGDPSLSSGAVAPSAVFYHRDPQAINMADAAFTAVITPGNASQIKSGLIYVDAQSTGVSENFLLPPEADCKGWSLTMFNVGGEAVAVQNDAGGAICTIQPSAMATLVCDGTTWHGGIAPESSVVAGAPVVTAGVSFTEDGSGTSYTATVEIPAGAVVHDIGFATTVLWDGTSASLDIGDDDDANGWFAGVNLKATDLLVGEVLSITNSENWGGKQGVYLVAATGRKGRTTAGVDSGVYFGAASEVIFLVTPGAADGSAGRSFGWVTYSVPSFVASTNV